MDGGALAQLKEEGVELHPMAEITLEEVKDCLIRMGREKQARSLKQSINKGSIRLITMSYRLRVCFLLFIGVGRTESLETALKADIKVQLKCLKFLFLGPPRSGKTTFLRRLIGKLVKLNEECENPSTTLGECTDAIIRICSDSDKASDTKVIISDTCTWSAIEDTCKESDHHKLDKEALMLYHFIEQTKKDDLSKQVENIRRNQEHSEILYQPEKQQPQYPLTDPHVQQLVMDHSTTAAITRSSLRHDSTPTVQDCFDPDLERLFTSWQKLLSEHKVSEIETIFKGSVLVNMIDIGGQPFFLDLFPALTIGPALFLVFFDLRQELNEHYPVKFVLDLEKDNVSQEVSQLQRTCKLDYEYSVQEVVFQILSSLSCFNPKNSQPQGLSVPPPTQAVSLIGTFLDLAGKECADKREQEVADELAYLTKVDFHDMEPYQKYIHKLDGKWHVLPVNNAGGVDEIRTHRCNLEKLIKRKFETFPVPASWLLFSVLLRRMDKAVVSLDQCKILAEKLHLQKVEDVLWFLHHHIGVLMYFEEISSLENVVICNPAVIFDCISELILNTFIPSKCYDETVREKFWRFGKFTYHDIEKAKTKDLDCEQVIALLKYLNVLVEDETSDHKTYFMHAVLKAAPKDELQKLSLFNDKVAPLVVRFNSGFVPIGCFSLLISQLLKCVPKEPPERKWVFQTKETELFKNKITFRLAGSYDVLVSHPKRYEIHVITLCDESDLKLKCWEACHQVRKVVCQSLEAVILELKKKFTNMCDDVTRYQIGFICSRKECEFSKQLKLEDHLMLVDSDSHQISSDQFCTCCNTGKSYHLKYAHHTVWSGRVSVRYWL